MPFESLEDELQAYLTKICEVQMSGQVDTRMVYDPKQGLRAKSRLDGSEQVISTDITRNDIRALATHDYLSLATPRAHWYLTATAKALTEYSEE